MLDDCLCARSLVWDSARCGCNCDSDRFLFFIRFVVAHFGIPNNSAEPALFDESVQRRSGITESVVCQNQSKFEAVLGRSIPDDAGFGHFSCCGGSHISFEKWGNHPNGDFHRLVSEMIPGKGRPRKISCRKMS